MTPNEARKHSGFKPIKGGEVLRSAQATAVEQKPGDDGESDHGDEKGLDKAKVADKEAV